MHLTESHVLSFASRSYSVTLLFLGVPPRSPSLFCTSLFFGYLSLALHPDGFLSLALPTSTIWNASPSGQSRHHRLPLVLSYLISPLLRRVYPLWVTLTDVTSPCLLMSGPFVFKPPFLFQIWPDQDPPGELFAYTRQLMFSPAYVRKVLFASCPPFPSWNPPSFIVELALSSCSRSDFPLSCQGTALANLGSLPCHDLVIWTDLKVDFVKSPP